MKNHNVLFSLIISFSFCVILLLISPNIETFISCVLSFFSLIATVIIYIATNKIQENQYCSQELSNLITEYRSIEFEQILIKIINFWINDCNKDINQISLKYFEAYNNSYNERGEAKNPDELSIHSCRRYLTQYYWSLWICIENIEKAEFYVKKYFNKNEMNFFVIIHLMNKACSSNLNIYRPLVNTSCESTEVNDEYLSKLYKKFNDICDLDEKNVLKWTD